MSKQKVYLIANCGTCQRILKEVGANADNFELQNIKKEAITQPQIEEMARLTGSYASLFSRRARKYRARGLHEQTLTESDYKALILEEYTFLKRPVFLIDGEIFVGNGKKTVAAVKKQLEQS